VRVVASWGLLRCRRKDQPGRCRARPGRSMHWCYVVVGAVGNGAATAPRRQPMDACSSASSHASSVHVVAEVRMSLCCSQRGA